MTRSDVTVVPIAGLPDGREGCDILRPDGSLIGSVWLSPFDDRWHHTHGPEDFGSSDEAVEALIRGEGPA